MEEVLGRPVGSPNLMAWMCDEKYGIETQRLDFAIFLDGHERSQGAKEAAVAEFQASWKRPKWHVLAQGQ